MKIIGLTGGIASGKSTVSSYLREKAYKIVDADLIARRVLMPNSNGLIKLVENFSEDILREDNSLDRKKLAAIVFNDPAKLQLLNSITHPIIREEILEEFSMHRENKEEIIIFDCPLLFEGGYETMCDETWLISINYEIQLSRLIVRDNIDKVQARKIIDSQMPLEEKEKLASEIIYNEENITSLYEAIDLLIEKL